MCIEDRPHVAKAMAADGGDFRFCASGQGEASHSSTAKIVEGEPDNADSDVCFCAKKSETRLLSKAAFRCSRR